MDRVFWPWKPYEGTLNLKKMEQLVLRAYTAWGNQRAKCYNPKDPCFKYYGEIGVWVHYSSREFIGWYLYYQNKLNLKDPSCGRIDHDGPYCFENIKLEEFQDNRRERAYRVGMPDSSNPVSMHYYATGKKVRDFRSISEAASFLRINVSTICRVLDGTIKTCGGGRGKPLAGYVFKYLEPG